ncbi:hypothetical protein [Streptococcus oricebi]|uniref:Uncharacterized protein n=1 Tax=Streptococcus oricebi TaxID=1547447 RepID=A0ABS5B0H0_9STRE|nr:hypothetical protein [Streptococcus oricebi]MBP2622332.1 hypothetical protein [Streptococcus oricebi]
MKKANQSYLEATNSYYKGVTEYKNNPQSANAVNRAKEFTGNISTKQVYDELVKSIPIEKRFNFSEEDLKRLNPVGYQFIKDLENGVTGDE